MEGMGGSVEMDAGGAVCLRSCLRAPLRLRLALGFDGSSAGPPLRSAWSAGANKTGSAGALDTPSAEDEGEDCF